MLSSKSSNMQVEKLGNVVRGGVSPLINEAQINVYSITQNDLSGNSTERNVHYECTGRMKARKYLRKSCCYRIECPAVNFLAAFIWGRPLNSAALAITTHRRPERVFNGTNTQVVVQMINKCRIKIVQNELYNIRDSPWIVDRKIAEESIVAI